VPDDVVEALRVRHESEGLSLNPHSATPGWLGERLDVGSAIDVLHPRATNEMSPLARLRGFPGGVELGFGDLDDGRGAAGAR
jgi:hypothetical protein